LLLSRNRASGEDQQDDCNSYDLYSGSYRSHGGLLCGLSMREGPNGFALLLRGHDGRRVQRAQI
jgi:hypothetical protein